MANSIDITLRGRDETGKAFDSAKKRVNDYGKSVDRAKQPTQNMAEVLEKMGGAASGGATSIARLGQAFGGISGPAAQAGAVIGSFLVGWQAGSKLMEMGLFGRSAKAQIESDFKFLEAGFKRAERLRAASTAADVAAVAAEDAGPAGALRKIIIQMNAEAAEAEQSIKEAGANLAKAQQQYNMMLPTLNREKVAQAKEAVDLARQELSAAREIAALRKQAAADTIETAERALRVALAERAARAADQDAAAANQMLGRVSKEQSDVDAAARRESTGPAREYADAIAQAEQLRVGIDREIDVAAQKLMRQQAALRDMARAEGDAQSDKTRELRRAVELTDRELETLREISDLRDRAATSIERAAKAAAQIQIGDMQAQLDIGMLQQEIQQFQRAAAQSAQNVGDIDAALAALNDPDAGRVARLALGEVGQGNQKGRQAAEQIQQAQEAANMMDRLAEMQRRKRDPDERRRMRDVARERDRIESRLERVRERERAGRPLAKWERELLAEADALQRGVGNKEAQRREQENARARADRVDEITVGLDRSKLGRMADDLKKLLTAAQG